MVNKHKLHS